MIDEEDFGRGFARQQNPGGLIENVSDWVDQ